MYSVSVAKSFIAQHFLIGGDFGDENIKHSHTFKIQLVIKSVRLNQHNYVIDIDDIKQFLKQVEQKYKDKCLNDFDEFKNQNPSIEFFAKLIHSECLQTIMFDTDSVLNVTVWEDDDCYASYEV